MMKWYFTLAGLFQLSPLCLFCGIIKTKQGEQLWASGSLSYTRTRELFLVKMEELGFDPNQFGLHSLSAGGASAAANAGVQTGCLNGMAIGIRRMPKTDM